MDVNFNIGLFVGITVLLFLDVLHAGVFAAFLLPVELLGNVAGCNRYWQVDFDLPHDVVQDVLVLHTSQFWVHREIIGHNCQGDVAQTFDFVAGEGSVTLLLGLHDGLGDVAVVEGLALLVFFGLSFGSFSGISDFLC